MCPRSDCKKARGYCTHKQQDYKHVLMPVLFVISGMCTPGVNNQLMHSCHEQPADVLVKNKLKSAFQYCSCILYKFSMDP